MSGVYRSENNNQYATGYAPIRLFNRLCAGSPIPAANCPESNLAFLPNLTSAKSSPGFTPQYGNNYFPADNVGPLMAKASAYLPGSAGSSTVKTFTQ